MLDADPMADVAPLRAIHFDFDTFASSLARIVAPPYDVIGPEHATRLRESDPHNAVRLILPEGDGDAKYANAKQVFDAWQADGTLVSDDAPCFYVLEQTFVPPGGLTSERVRRRGFFGLVRALPFSERVVLPHERTLSGPKVDRLKLWKATGANMSPGFMLYEDRERTLDAVLDRAERIAEFETPDGVGQTLSRIENSADISAITKHLATSRLLIADGHHRYETAVKYAEDARAERADPWAAHQFVMTFLVSGDDPDLLVFPTHRHVHGLGGFDRKAVLARLDEVFEVEALPKNANARQVSEALARAGEGGTAFAMADVSGEVHLLRVTAPDKLDAHPVMKEVERPLRHADVAILHGVVLEGILGITKEAQAAKTNLWYPQDLKATLEAVRQGAGDVVFFMNATPVGVVRDVAEAGQVMPQKATFFYPKVPSGVCFHRLGDAPVDH